MKRARVCGVVLALIAATAGCGGDGETVTPTLTLTLTPSAITVLVNSFIQYALNVNVSAEDIRFFVNDVEGGNATFGTIDAAGLYHAPPVVPSETITIKVTAIDSATKAPASDTSTVTLDSGVRVSILPSTFIIGTNEEFTFCARVSGVPANPATTGDCNNTDAPDLGVTWTVSGVGSVDSSTGDYAAPSTTGSATITAKSVYDTTKTATASITIVTATDPTLTSISNTVGAVGAVHQDVYLTGTNFISTTNVFLGGTLVPASSITRISSTVLHVRIPDTMLTAADTFEFTASRQSGTVQDCSSPAQCTLVLTARRPALVGSSEESVPQGISTTVDLSGGYFGTNGAPVVTARFGSQADSAQVISAKLLRVGVSGTDVDAPGLVPITVASSVPGATVGPAVMNLAVQPSYPTSLLSEVAGSPLDVGTSPSAVAINTATGIAVVANQGSHDVTLVSVTGAIVATSICTGTLGSAAAPCAVASAPTGVAVDNLRNIALVANSGTSTVAVVDLTPGSESVTAIIPAGPTSIADVPVSVGINPLSGMAIVAYEAAGFASIIDLKLPTPAVTGLVNAGTGATPRVAVSPKLNWALVTPGGSGALTLVDLDRQTVTSITSASRNGGIATIATASAHGLRVGDIVLVTGVTDASFNGVFGVSDESGNTFKYSQSALPNANSAGGLASYSLPVATVASVNVRGVAINDETQKAILVDPTATVRQAFIFNLLDQSPSSSGVTGLAANIDHVAAAFNPLANIAVVVNRTNGNAIVVDPTTPAALATFFVGITPVDVAIDPGTNTAVVVNQGSNDVSIFSLGTPRTAPQVLQASRQVSAPDLWEPPEIEVTSTLTTPVAATDQTLKIIGSGFDGTSVMRLDGTGLATTLLSSRELTATVPAAMLTAGPRRYALDVANGADASNAAGFTVIQSVDLSGTGGCAEPAPQGVAIDSRRNLAVVSNPGCNPSPGSVSLINLDTGMGQTVLVGTNPQGVAVDLQTGFAVVANQASNNASIVNVSSNTVVATVNTDPGPTGVAIDPGLGQVLVTASNANVVDSFALSATPGSVTTFAVQQGPGAIAVDPTRHLAAVANTTNNSVSLVDLTRTVATEHIAASGLPAGVAFDPVSAAFLVTTSLNNRFLVLDPTTRSTTSFRVGINPTSIAFNFAAGTLVTTNSSSETMTVVDSLQGQVRAVLSVRPSGQFAVDIHPFSNLAVIADSAGNRVLLLPLPR